MKTEIIATGDEVLCGDLVDTNTAWLAGRLSGIGADVRAHHVVGDDMEALVSRIRQSAEESDLVILTGGMGPTEDDLTRDAVGKAFGVPLVKNDEALEGVKKWFENRNREMPDSNLRQGLIPEGAKVIPNRWGTAPAFCFFHGKTRIYCLPGVPREMKGLFSGPILTELLEACDTDVFEVKVITLFGSGESWVAELLSGSDGAFHGFPATVHLGYRASFPEIHIRLYARGKSRADVEKSLSLAKSWVLARTGEFLVSAEGLRLPEAVGAELLRQKKTVAVAESCTGGLIGHLLTSVSGSSDYFLFSGVTYSNDAKTAVLGVNPETIKVHGAVSESVASEMAKGARTVAHADYGLATSGVAGPTGGSPEKPVGMVCFGLSAGNRLLPKTVIRDYRDRSLNKQVFAFAALWHLLCELRTASSRESETS